MILVTGANGHFGAATIDHLLQHVPVNNIVGLVRSEEKGADLRRKGVTVRVGDYAEPASLNDAFRGVTKMLLVSGTDLEHRAAQHRHVIDAAAAAGVEHIVYTSFYRHEDAGGVLGQLADGHVATEAHLEQSGVPYTLLLNTLYAEVLPLFFGPAVLDQGIYLPAGDGAFSPAERDDMAEAAARILAGDGHAGQSYVIANTRNHTFSEIAGMIAEVSGKEVTYTAAETGQFRQVMQGAGVPDEAIGMTIAFSQAIAQGELRTPQSDLPALLGREPRSLRAFLERTYG